MTSLIAVPPGRLGPSRSLCPDPPGPPRLPLLRSSPLLCPIRSDGGSRMWWVYRVGLAAVEPLLALPPFQAAPLRRLGFPCPPCLSLCVWEVGFRVLPRAQLGRLGGSRWGWALQIKFPCHNSLSLSPCPIYTPFSYPPTYPAHQ